METITEFHNWLYTENKCEMPSPKRHIYNAILYLRLTEYSRTRSRENVNASLNSHQWSFLMQQIVTNSESCNWPKCREYKTAEGSPLSRTPTSNLCHPRFKGPLWKRGWKDCESRKWLMTRREQFSRQLGSYAYELTAMVTVCPGTMLAQARHSLRIEAGNCVREERTGFL